MKATINAKHFGEWLDAVSAVWNEGIVTTTNSGLHTCIKEPGNVMLVNTVLGANSFDEYDAPTAHDIGFDLGRVKEAMSIARSKETVTLQYPGESGPLSLRLETPRGVIELATLPTDTITEKASVGDLEFDVDVTVPVSVLKEGHKACTFATENVVELEADEAADKIAFKGVGDNSKVSLDLDREEASEWSISGHIGKAMYDEKYFASALSGIPSDTDEVRIRFSENYPMMFSFDVAAGMATYLLAPRIPKAGGAA